MYENLNQSDAYQKAYPDSKRESAEVQASKLISLNKVTYYIDELKAAYYKDKLKIIEGMFPQTLIQFKTILETAKNDGHRMEAIREVWDRLMPKESKQTITIEYVNVFIQKLLVIIKEEVKDVKTCNKITERVGSIYVSENSGGIEAEGDAGL